MAARSKRIKLQLLQQPSLRKKCKQHKMFLPALLSLLRPRMTVVSLPRCLILQALLSLLPIPTLDQ